MIKKNTHILHLISDSTGETIRSLTRSCLVQFENVEKEEHFWPLVNTPSRIENVKESILKKPGLVLYTIADYQISEDFKIFLNQNQLPFISLLDSTILAFSNLFGIAPSGKIGEQHKMDAQYFKRINSMQFSIDHDDGIATHELKDAEVILLGISRTSKSPTSLYLGNMGIDVANIPVVINIPLPEDLFKVHRLKNGPIIIGLVKSPEQLAGIRRQRMVMLTGQTASEYSNIDSIREELRSFRKLCRQYQWPIIDVSHRSIEETSAEIIRLLESKKHAL